jgi:hypothetical protein
MHAALFAMLIGSTSATDPIVQAACGEQCAYVYISLSSFLSVRVEEKTLLFIRHIFQ